LIPRCYHPGAAHDWSATMADESRMPTHDSDTGREVADSAEPWLLTLSVPLFGGPRSTDGSAGTVFTR
jgi:hypothetical protein